jgi:hypothetical protein
VIAEWGWARPLSLLRLVIPLTAGSGRLTDGETWSFEEAAVGGDRESRRKADSRVEIRAAELLERSEAMRRQSQILRTHSAVLRAEFDELLARVAAVSFRSTPVNPR